MKTVVGLFKGMPEARGAVQDLENAGFAREDIGILANEEAARSYAGSSGHTDTEGAGSGAMKGAGTGAAIGGGIGLIAGLTSLAIPGFGAVIAAGPIASALAGAGIGAAAGGLIGGLTKVGVSEHDAEHYAEGVRRGGVLVTVRTADEMAEQAADILENHDADDVEKRAEEWRKEGWAGGRTAESSRTEKLRAKPSSSEQASIPVIEEQLQVGSRSVRRGGVRLYSEVQERPVEEDITLREERVRVERHPVNRPATEGDFEAFREGAIELTETTEEPVVSKRAKVVEEVVAQKEVRENKEKVRDTVRRSDVRVEPVGTTGGGFEDDFRSDFRTRYAGRGYQYERYAPAYEFGSEYARNPRYADADWSVVERDARRDWESRGQGAWEEFKDSIRFGWERMRGRR